MCEYLEELRLAKGRKEASQLGGNAVGKRARVLQHFLAAPAVGLFCAGCIFNTFYTLGEIVTLYASSETQLARGFL